MKLNMYTIFDRASMAYMRPFFYESDGAAVRAFGDIAADADHMIGKHPEDYSLYRCGMFDDQTGSVVDEKLSCLARAHELVAAARQGVKKKELEETVRAISNDA